MIERRVLLKRHRLSDSHFDLMRNLGRFRKPTGHFFVEDLGAVETDFEPAAIGRDEREILDLVRVLFQERRRQTGGAGKMISGHAVHDLHFHGDYLKRTHLVDFARTRPGFVGSIICTIPTSANSRPVR